MRYKVISFYSEPDQHCNYYTDHSKRFISNCKEFDIDYHVEELKGKGDYFKNCRMKPGFILDCMNKFNMPLLWLDIDTIIKTNPILNGLSNIDFGAIRHTNPRGKFPIFAHCLFFNDTQDSLKLLNVWKKRCEQVAGKHVGDHSILSKLIKDQNIMYKFIDDFTKYTLASTKEVKSKIR